MEAERVIVGQSKYEFNRLVLMYRNKDRFTHHIFKYSNIHLQARRANQCKMTWSLIHYSWNTCFPYIWLSTSHWSWNDAGWQVRAFIQTNLSFFIYYQINFHFDNCNLNLGLLLSLCALTRVWNVSTSVNLVSIPTH